MYEGDKNQLGGNLNEDINMQLYGQISMFDQLTDYNDIDNDDDNMTQHNRHRMRHLQHRQGGKGEDEYSDNGEEEAGNLYQCRQRIQAINDELQNFIAMMTDCQGEDDEDESYELTMPGDSVAQEY